MAAISLDLSDFCSAELSVLTTGAGVPAGAKSAIQLLALNIGGTLLRRRGAAHHPLGYWRIF